MNRSTRNRQIRNTVTTDNSNGTAAVGSEPHRARQRMKLVACCLAAGALAGLLSAGPALAGDVILETYDTSLLTYLYDGGDGSGGDPGATLVQDVRPLAIQRGVFLDGTRRLGSVYPMNLAGNPFGDGWNGNASFSGIHLGSGAYAMTDVDIALPDGIVIGRSFNAGQQDDSAAHYDSDGYQGRNMFQMSQPEIVLHDDSGGDQYDVLYLVYGADRYIEFLRIETGAVEFKSKNGAAGGVVFTAASGGEPETYTYTDQNGNQFVFFGFDANSAPAKGQFWKAITPDHPTDSNVAYVGDASTGSTAISNGYDGTTGAITTAYDAADRRYTYTYTTYDSVKRLTQVKVETKSGGTWASPTGVTERAKVDYEYYRTGQSTTYGDLGCLERVTVAMPLTDSGINAVSNTYYRYWKGTFDDSTNPGHPYSLAYIVEQEGCRAYDWEADSDMDDGTAEAPEYETATETNLKPYASAYFEYDSSHRVDKGWFNGACGCSGAANGVHTFEYENNGSHPGNAGYDEEWKSRVTIGLPDGSYQVQYLDEMAQPLTRVTANGDPDVTSGRSYWVTEVIRDDKTIGSTHTDGVLLEIRSPEANSSYTHSSASISANASAGLITTFTRLTTGDKIGFLESVKHKKGTSGTEYFDRKITLTSTDKAVSASSPTVTIVRPVVSSSKVYESETSSDTGGIETTYTYTWYTSELFPKKILTTYPAVTTAKNGSNSSNTSARYLRRDGTTAFSEAPDGIFTYTQFTNGQLTKRIDDVKTNGTFDTGDDPDSSTYPEPGWGITPTGDGVDRTTTITYDEQGRRDTLTAPDSDVSKMYYTALSSQRWITLSIPRFTSGSPDTFYGPVPYSLSNQVGKSEFSGLIALSGGSSTTALSSWIDEADVTADDPLTALDVGSVARMSTSIYDEPGTTLETSRVYFDVPASGAGTDGTNYDQTTYAYTDSGQIKSVKDPTGTYRDTVYDAIGRVSEQHIGTNNSGAGPDNMVKTSDVVYDSGGVGNGLVTTQTAYVVDGTTDQRVTTFEYDYRGRRIVINNPTAPHVLSKFDNLGRQTATGLYSDSSGLDEADDPTTLATDRMALSESKYDEMGRVYETVRHKIDDADGSDDDSLTSDTWHDAAGRVIKVVGEQISKTTYDRLGRQTHAFVLAIAKDSGGSTETTYVDAADVAYDKVLEERQTVYESTNSNNVLMSLSLERFHDDAGGGDTDGALDSNADGDALLVTAANLKGRPQITAMWYDDDDRMTSTVSYGTNGGSNFDRDPLSVPTRSDTALRTDYAFNDDGTLLSVTDPRNLKTQFVYDDLGRQVTVIANYVNGTPSGANGDDDVHTRYVFTDGLQTKMWADIDGDGTEDAEDQVTTYSFGVTGTDSPGPSKITVGNLLRTVTYPDSGGASDTVRFAYNAQGQQIWTQDQSGNVIETDFDTSGRETARKVTTLDGDFDGAVKMIETTYDSLGRRQLVTQYDAVTSGTIVNEVKLTYEDWGNIERMEYDRDGAVQASAGNEYDVACAYAKATSGRQTVRRTQMTLPSTAVIAYDYTNPSGVGYFSESSRVRAIRRDSAFGTIVTQYQYNGLGRLVGTSYDEADVMWNQYTTSGNYPDLDQFNRITSSRWTKDLATDVDFYDVDITYDRNSNITVIEDNVHSGFDVKYTMDNLNRLTDAQEGTYSAGSISSETRQQTWSLLDQLGNWEDVQLDLDGDGSWGGANEYDDDRTHNVVNELTGRDTDDNGTDDYTLVYDEVGNLTDDGKEYLYTYDAFGRLRKINSKSFGNPLVTEYTYNGLGQRVSIHWDTDGDGTVESNGDDPTEHLMYDERWRMLAVFLNSDTAPTEEFVPHQAGLSGMGASSYIDDVILRDRDTDDNGSLDERIYYCSNWRHDVSAIVTSGGKMLEWVKYTSYGVPMGLPAGDTDSDFDWDATDSAAITGSYDARKDAELDGDVDANDITHANSITGGYQTLGWEVMSSTGTMNRKGYAGYEGDHAISKLYHVRHRVLHTELGRWTRRDPLGYVDGACLIWYTENNPARWTDATGLTSDPFFQDRADIGLPCCCCVDSLDVNEHFWWADDGAFSGRNLAEWGVFFSVTVETTWKPLIPFVDRLSNDCQLQWFEKSNAPYNEGHPGWMIDEWYEHTRDPNSIRGKTLSPWFQDRSRSCGRTDTTVLIDYPQFKTFSSKFTYTRYLTIAIRVRSSEQCVAHQLCGAEELVFYVTILFCTRGGVPDMGCSGFFPYKWPEELPQLHIDTKQSSIRPPGW